jgi:putative membrane protein
MVLRIHGSCLPQLIIPLLLVSVWTTGVCLFSKRVENREFNLQNHDDFPADQRSCVCFAVGISSTLLTVLGFVVALSLSFRSSTAYERYMEGRRCWTTLTIASQNLARNLWINAVEREDHAKDDLLAKVFVFNLPRPYSKNLTRVIGLL